MKSQESQILKISGYLVQSQKANRLVSAFHDIMDLEMTPSQKEICQKWNWEEVEVLAEKIDSGKSSKAKLIKISKKVA